MATRSYFRSLAIALVAGLTFAPQLSAQSMPPGPIGEVAMEFDSLVFRSIGPATMSGRVADLAVYEANPAIYYVATAHGGLWRTESGGVTFEGLFQDQGLISIGTVAISQSDPDLVWIGTGESNNRQTTSWGSGIYKSTDGGQSFEFMGLPESRHVQRIVIHPEDDDVVLVAATGPLFGSGGDRGIYRTTDGGRSWDQVLYVDEDTGGNELVFSPQDPDIVFASTYQRRRTTCCMNGGGEGSAVWRSADAGATWTKVEGGGFPSGPLGRIALDVFSLDDDIVYALLQAPSPDEDDAPEPQGLWRSDDGGRTWEQRSGVNPRPMYFSHLKIDPVDPDRVYMGGVGMHLSIDGGSNFERDASRAIHDDVHSIWINPNNPNHVLIGNDGGLAVSWDASVTWQFLPNLPVGLFYHVNYDMERPFNICGGMQDNYNWCGPSATRFRRGIMNYDWFQVRGGDGFVAMPDLNNPRIVYAESQGGNMVRRDIVTGESKSIRPTSANTVNSTPDDPANRWHWDTPFIRSPHDPGVLIAAAQRVFRSTDRGDSWVALSGDLTTNTDRNQIETMGVVNTEISMARNDGISRWGTVVSLAESPYRPGLYWTGSDDGLVHLSKDGGASWEDVTANIPGIPEGVWISEVVPSRYVEGRIYVTVDAHLENDYDPYIWVSEDFGQSFRSITSGLDGQNVRTLTEDHRNPDVLYVGTETGVFLTRDRGESWRRIRANLPTVRVDEITLHERDNAMLVATHGRALFVLDDASPLQEYSESMAEGPAQLFSIRDALQWKSLDDRNDEFWGHQFFVGENPPTDAVIHMQVMEEVDELALHIYDRAGRMVRELEAPESRRAPGIRTMCWDQRVAPIAPPDLEDDASGGGGGGGGGGGFGGGGSGNAVPGIPSPQPEAGFRSRNVCAGLNSPGQAGPHVTPGDYRVDLVVDGVVVDSEPMRIHQDPEVLMNATERMAYDNIVTDLHEMQREGTYTAAQLTRLYRSMEAAADEIEGGADVPGDVEDDFEDFQEAFEELRGKFGVPLAQRGGGFGGGFGGGGGGGDNALQRVGQVKGSISAFWETPSDALVAAYYDAKAGLVAAMAEADALMATARVLSAALGEAGVELEVPDSM